MKKNIFIKINNDPVCSSIVTTAVTYRMVFHKYNTNNIGISRVQSNNRDVVVFKIEDRFPTFILNDCDVLKTLPFDTHGFTLGDYGFSEYRYPFFYSYYEISLESFKMMCQAKSLGVRTYSVTNELSLKIEGTDSMSAELQTYFRAFYHAAIDDSVYCEDLYRLRKYDKYYCREKKGFLCW